MGLIFKGNLLLCMQTKAVINGDITIKDSAKRIEEISDRIKVEDAYLTIAKARFKENFVEYIISSSKIRHELEKLHEEREKLKNEMRPKL